ncbi:MAG: hypothetical protein Q4G53_01765 [Clostridia bacterium]|nr:hypothetical protein [Clostridia bacterium]
MTLLSKRAAGAGIAAEQDLAEWTLEGKPKQNYFGVGATEYDAS